MNYPIRIDAPEKLSVYIDEQIDEQYFNIRDRHAALAGKTSWTYEGKDDPTPKDIWDQVEKVVVNDLYRTHGIIVEIGDEKYTVIITSDQSKLAWSHYLLMHG